MLINKDALSMQTMRRLAEWAAFRMMKKHFPDIVEYIRHTFDDGTILERPEELFRTGDRFRDAALSKKVFPNTLGHCAVMAANHMQRTGER